MDQDKLQERYFAADAESDDERARLRLLEQAQDPFTIRHLMRIGVVEGWRCLEVGAGGGSITRWLAEQVGPTGQVVATDVDLRFLDDLDLPNVEVHRHDIVKDTLEENHYHLVHCRALLLHLSDPDAVVGKLVRAIRPGGWLLVEEPDMSCFGPVDDTHPLATSGVLRRIFNFLRAEGIWNPFVGRQLPLLLARLGLTDIDNEAVTRIGQGGGPMADYFEKSLQLVDPGLLEGAVLTEEEITDRGRALGDPAFWFINFLRVSAWGRRPT